MIPTLNPNEPPILDISETERLITGRKTRGGLMSPRALRIVSVLLLVLPVVGLFTGYYREMGAVAIYQAVMYLLGFVGLRRLARKREANDDPKQPTSELQL